MDYSNEYNSDEDNTIMEEEKSISNPGGEVMFLKAKCGRIKHHNKGRQDKNFDIRSVLQNI